MCIRDSVNTRRGFAAILAIAFLPAVGLPVIGGFMLYKFLKPGEAPKADETKKAHDEHAKPAPPHPSIITAKAAA